MPIRRKSYKPNTITYLFGRKKLDGRSQNCLPTQTFGPIIPALSVFSNDKRFSSKKVSIGAWNPVSVVNTYGKVTKFNLY